METPEMTMQAGRSTLDIRGSIARDATPLAAAMGAYGVSTAFLSPTTSLFLSNAVHVAPLLIGVFFAVRGAAAITANQTVGLLSDRLPDRRSVLGISGACMALGCLCMAVLRGYVAVLVTVAVFLGVGGTGFAQLFAYAADLATTRGQASTAFTAWIRSAYAASWVVGPPVGLFLLTRYGFGHLYLAASGLSLASAVLARWGLRQIPALSRPAHLPGKSLGRKDRSALGLGPASSRIWLLLGSVVVLSVVNQIYNIDIALYVTKDLHLPAQLVGWMAGTTAALEIPVMIIAGRAADQAARIRLLLSAAAGATAFFCLLPLARSALPLLALQLVNAAWSAVALSIPITMIQDEAPGRPGASSALYSSAFTTAVLLAGAITGVAATAVGYANVFWVCAALSIIAGGLLLSHSRAAHGNSENPGTTSAPIPPSSDRDSHSGQEPEIPQD